MVTICIQWASLVGKMPAIGQISEAPVSHLFDSRGSGRHPSIWREGYPNQQEDNKSDFVMRRDVSQMMFSANNLRKYLRVAELLTFLACGIRSFTATGRGHRYRAWPRHVPVCTAAATTGTGPQARQPPAMCGCRVHQGMLPSHTRRQQFNIAADSESQLEGLGLFLQIAAWFITEADAKNGPEEAPRALTRPTGHLTASVAGRAPARREFCHPRAPPRQCAQRR